MIPIEIAPGELFDKLTILEIKLERITDPAKRANCKTEWSILDSARREHVTESPQLASLIGDLRRVNEALWVIEDDIREQERQKDFGPKFIELARAVYVQNDERARVKRAINELLGSRIIEEKSYAKY